jgi:hypothetical protein
MLLCALIREGVILSRGVFFPVKFLSCFQTFNEVQIPMVCNKALQAKQRENKMLRLPFLSKKFVGVKQL